ncbi:MAG: heavy-metal-associated domain-containing protein [Galactobacter sp.]
MNTTLNISGMTCNHCALSVTEELEALDGVTDVSIDLHPNEISTAQVTTDREIPTEQLSEAVAEAGYTVVGDHA